MVSHFSTAHTLPCLQWTKMVMSLIIYGVETFSTISTSHEMQKANVYKQMWIWYYQWRIYPKSVVLFNLMRYGISLSSKTNLPFLPPFYIKYIKDQLSFLSLHCSLLEKKIYSMKEVVILKCMCALLQKTD